MQLQQAPPHGRGSATASGNHGKDWLQVGYPLQIGRNAVFRAAGINAPFGKVYTRFMSNWLRSNQFDDIGQQVRYRLLQCVENIIAIEKWRGTLDESRRLRFNHPDSVWHHWKRSTSSAPSRCTNRNPRQWNGTSKAVSGGYHRPVNFDQDMTRRAAIAIGENWSNDTYRLAAVALRAAIRNEADLLALLPAASGAPPRAADRAQATHADA
jgi:hypothetical protein